MEQFTSCDQLLRNTPAHYNAKVLSNVDLFHFTSFSQLFSEGCACIYLLYPWRESEPNIGHWCLVTKRGPIVNFFDPYAFDVDGHAIRRALRHITRLMYRDFERYHFYKNTVPLQAMKMGVNTCGRWCLLFMNDPCGYEKTVDIDDWAKKIKQRAAEMGMTNDAFLMFVSSYKGAGKPLPGPRLSFQLMKFYKDDLGNMKLLPENERGQIQREIIERKKAERKASERKKAEREAKRKEREAEREAKRKEREAERKEAEREARRKEREARRKEREAERKEAERKEAERKEREAERKEAEREARRKEREAERKEREARRKEREAERKEAERKEAERKEREDERKEREAERKEREAKRKEAERKERKERKEAERKEAERKEREAERKEAERKEREAERKEAERKEREAERKEAERKEAERKEREAELEADPREEWVRFDEMKKFLGDYLNETQIQMIQDEDVLFTDMVDENQDGELKFILDPENVKYLLDLYDTFILPPKEDALKSNPNTGKMIKRGELNVLGALLEIPRYNIATGKNNLKKGDLITQIIKKWK